MWVAYFTSQDNLLPGKINQIGLQLYLIPETTVIQRHQCAANKNAEVKYTNSIAPIILVRH